ncbi:hypothetical protein OROHE_019001 [Orobanche hederae]
MGASRRPTLCVTASTASRATPFRRTTHTVVARESTAFHRCSAARPRVALHSTAADLGCQFGVNAINKNRPLSDDDDSGLDTIFAIENDFWPAHFDSERGLANFEDDSFQRGRE